MRYLASLFALFTLALTLALAEPIPRAAPAPGGAGDLVGRRERVFGRPAAAAAAAVPHRDDLKRAPVGARAGTAATEGAADSTTNYVSSLLLSCCSRLPVRRRRHIRFCVPSFFDDRDEDFAARGRAPERADCVVREGYTWLGRLRHPRLCETADLSSSASRLAASTSSRSIAVSGFSLFRASQLVTLDRSITNVSKDKILDVLLRLGAVVKQEYNYRVRRRSDPSPHVAMSPLTWHCLALLHRSTRASSLRFRPRLTRDSTRGLRHCRRKRASSTSRRTRSCAPTRAMHELRKPASFMFPLCAPYSTVTRRTAESIFMHHQAPARSLHSDVEKIPSRSIAFLPGVFRAPTGVASGTSRY